MTGASGMEKWTTPVFVGTLVGVGVSLVMTMMLSNSNADDDKKTSSSYGKGTNLFPSSSPDDVLNLIQKRRSIFPKQYSTRPVPKQIIEQMLEAARWAPTHNLTEPWKFVVFESQEARKELGQFLADQYKKVTTSADTNGTTGKNKGFVQAKYDKKINNCKKSSCIIALICDTSKKKNPIVEEISSVAMAVQNMSLMAAAHGIGAYWSSGSTFDKKAMADGSSSSADTGTGSNSPLLVVNPAPTREFLNLQDDDIFLGWLFVGDFFGESEPAEGGAVGSGKKWPEGRRKELQTEGRLLWK